MNCQRNEILQYINECETDATKRVAEELLRVSGINTKTNEKPKLLSKKYNVKKCQDDENKYTNKVMHGYFYRKLSNGNKIDQKT